MKANIEVASRAEADSIKAGLTDPVVRAYVNDVNVIGILMQLPSDRARARVLAYVQDKLAEETTPPNKD